MKHLFSWVFICSVAFSGTLQIKDDDVELSINTIDKKFKNGDIFDFIDGSNICFKNGKGRVIVNNKFQLTKINKECFQTEVKDNNSFKKIINGFKNSLLVAFSNSNENVVDGVSSKSIKTTNNQKILNIDSTVNNIVIYSESSGPLPITLIVESIDGNIKNKIYNNEDSNSIFIIKTENLHNNDVIKVVNGFGTLIQKFTIQGI
jgi:hypothetical protein